ncbi:MAG: GNAT family N-acetyltransferase [Aquamicrobium sp.]|uniref:GNAT family N-acetyltransferase n=1 Tax=Aquamicrobium sp. TaxID=1872579 RepID=UPI00349EE1B7|nr:GNAT family N-acetyltransferase [Aquamicrobium sp.]
MDTQDTTILDLPPEHAGIFAALAYPGVNYRTVTDARVPVFVGTAVGSIIYPPFTAMGLDRRGKIVAGAVFNCFTGADVHATIAGHVWTRGFLADVGEYLFNQLKVERVTAITHQEKVVRIAQRLGGKVEGRLRNHFGRGRDGLVIGILRDDWKF